MKRNALLLPAAFAMLGAQPVAAADGAGLFKQNCAVCHSVEPGENKIGPSLAGIVGQKAAAAPGYRYSPAFSKLGHAWDRAHLDAFLKAPMASVPGTKMAYPGLAAPADRDAIITYLEQQ